jgi:RHS repeat-associated protein
MGGIMDYRARFYSPALMRFLQPDSIVPDQSNPQSWNRYSYVTNRPVNFNDPTGHIKCEFDAEGNDFCYENDRKTKIRKDPVKTKEEPDKPWEYTVDVDLEMHIGPAQDANVPDYYGESENSDNVPYIPGISNPRPSNVCVGKAAILCLFSLGTSIASPYGPVNTNPNFFLNFSISYVEATNSINMSTVQVTKAYPGNATLAMLVNNRVISVGDVYMPQSGHFPIEMSQGQYDGGNRLTIEVMVRTLQNTPNGPGLIPHPMKFMLPSLSEAKNIVLSGLP